MSVRIPGEAVLPLQIASSPIPASVFSLGPPHFLTSPPTGGVLVACPAARQRSAMASRETGGRERSKSSDRARTDGPKTGVTKPMSKRRLPGVDFDLPRVSSAKVARADSIADLLAAMYPDAHCELDYRHPHELLVATILSAQTTDAGVNRCTPSLFAAYPTPADYLRATPEDIEPHIKRIGLFRSKAKAVCQTMRDIHERFGGEVPRRMEDLLTLRGVARKTASVVLGNCFGINVGFVVDTHVHRLSQRLGLVPWGTPVAKAEKILMACFVHRQSEWCQLSHRFIFHGRRACKAKGGQEGSGPNGAGSCCAVNALCEGFGQSCEFRVKGVRRAAETPTKPKR